MVCYSLETFNHILPSDFGGIFAVVTEKDLSELSQNHDKWYLRHRARNHNKTVPTFCISIMYMCIMYYLAQYPKSLYVNSVTFFADYF